MAVISAVKARRKLAEWFKRYLPAEIAGTFTALIGAWLGYQASGSLGIMAVCGTVGENVGYYGVAIGREVWNYWQRHQGHAHLRRLWLAGLHAFRDISIEFGPAEALDSLFVRPGLFYVIPFWLGANVPALLLAKILADVIFYGFAIVGYEARKKLFKKKKLPAQSDTK